MLNYTVYCTLEGSTHSNLLHLWRSPDISQSVICEMKTDSTRGDVGCEICRGKWRLNYGESRIGICEN